MSVAVEADRRTQYERPASGPRAAAGQGCQVRTTGPGGRRCCRP